MSDTSPQSDFSQGSMLSNIWKISAPMMLALLINVLYSVVDRVYIGHIPGTGSLALTGIGLAFPITTVISAFQNLCSTGGSPLFAIARGRADEDEARNILGNAYALLLFFGLALTVAGYLCKDEVLYWTGASADTFAYADDYLSVYLTGTVFVLTSLGMNPFINAQGFPRVGMLTVLIGAIINIILDPIFIFALDMGVRGAAAATVIAQGVSAAWVLCFLLSKRAAVRLTGAAMRPRADVIRRMLALGVTGFTFSVTNSAVAMLYNASLARMGGDIWVSAMTVVNSLREIVHMPVQGFTGGAQPVLGYNYGARKFARVREGIGLITRFCLAYMALAWAALMAFPGPFVRLFSDDAALLPVASEAIRLFFCLQVFMAFQSAGQTTFVSLGKTRQALCFSLLRKVVLVIPLALVLPRFFGLGVRGVFLSEPISDLIGGLSCYLVMWYTLGRKLGREEA